MIKIQKNRVRVKQNNPSPFQLILPPELAACKPKQTNANITRKSLIGDFMIYSVEMKTTDPKTSVQFNCNDFEKAIVFFQNCINAHWNMGGEIQIKLIQNVGKNSQEVTIMYQLDKYY